MAKIAPQLPHWIAPPLGSSAFLHRTSWTRPGSPVFWSPVSVMLFRQVFDRMKWMGLGYLLFRITSDVERLPFPLAPIAASGATALAEASTKEESWRWRVFSTGTIIGLLFGFFYLAIPIFTGVAFGKPLQLLPIPFLDLTPSPSASCRRRWSATTPTWARSWSASCCRSHRLRRLHLVGSRQIGLNPILYHCRLFPHYISGSPAIQTKVSIDFDFWMSFGIGTQLAIAVIGLVPSSAHWCGGAARSSRRGAAVLRRCRRGAATSRGRPRWAPGCLRPSATSSSTTTWCRRSPSGSSSFTRLFWTPLNSYVSARMIALTGNGVSFPFLNQAVVLSSHYTRPGHLVRAAAAERLRRPGPALPRDRADRHQVHEHPETGAVHAAADPAFSFLLLGLPVEDH